MFALDREFSNFHKKVVFPAPVFPFTAITGIFIFILAFKLLYSFNVNTCIFYCNRVFKSLSNPVL